MAGSNRTVGLVLLASVAFMVVLALCAWTGVLPVAPESRSLVAMALGIGAVADMLVAVVLLTRS